MKITEAFERGEFVVTAEVGPPERMSHRKYAGGSEDLSQRYHSSQCNR